MLTRRNKRLALLAGLLAASHAAAQECMSWQRSVLPAGPPGAQFAHMTFDASRSRVLWCGATTPSAPTQAWEWNGLAWVDRTPPAGAGMFGRVAGLAYDSQRGVCVLQLSIGATCEYDGAAWSNRGLIGPPPRSNPGMAYDPLRGQIVLFGGQSGANPIGDTWTYDGVAWTQRTPAHAPSPRQGASMTFDTARGVAVLHGGNVAGVNSTNETWEWNGLDWALVSTDGPDCAAHCGVFAGGLTLIFSGAIFESNVATLRRDVWGWDGDAWRFIGEFDDPEFAIGLNSAAEYDPVRGEIVFQQTSQVLGQTITRRIHIGFAGLASQPQDLAAQEGTLAAFGVTASGSRPCTYQWRRNGVPINGATAATLLLHDVTQTQAGEYDCLVASFCGTSVSRAAQLTVTPVCAGDINGDGERNFTDLNALLGVYGLPCVPR